MVDIQKIRVISRLKAKLLRLKVAISLVASMACMMTCCSHSDSQIVRLEKKLVLINEDILTAGSIIVIPREGCGGCIQNATSFVIKKIDSIGSIVIFTGVNDKKLLRAQLGEKFISNTGKYFFDTGNLLMESHLTSIYPVIILIKDSKIQSIETFTPKLP